MNMLSNEKVNFKSLEENTFKEMMKLGRTIIQDELRMIDNLIKKYRDTEIFKPKDFQPTTIKTKKHKGKKKFKVKHFKKKKSKKKKNGIELKIAVIHEGKESRYTNDYKLRNKIIVGTASTSSQLKKIEDMNIGTKYKEYKIKNVVINGDGADWTGSIVEGAKEIFQLDMAHIQKKIYIAVSDEEYLKQMQQIVYSENATDIFSLIYNYKVELETENKIAELEKVKELEEYLKNNERGLLRYQYKLGYKEEQLEKKKKIYHH